ncbi:MAG TPA: hypothetical protein VF456_13380, partial [Vicinamibacterales bacterium]
MSRRFTIVTLSLAAVVAFLVGVIVAGGVRQSSVSAGPTKRIGPAPAAHPASVPVTGLVNFADVVERINPAVVNIDATGSADNRRRRPGSPDMFDAP